MSTVGKAATLLELFTMKEPELGLSELARRADLNKATTRRLLMVLLEHRLVEQAPKTRDYRLGAAVSRLARIRETNFPFSRIARPVLQDLAAETGETVHLSEFSGGALFTVAVELSAQANRVNIEADQVLPLHGTASGIAFLAFTPPDFVRSYLGRRLTAFTSHTLTNQEAVAEQIRLAAARGYSTSAQGFSEGVHSIASPILGPGGQAMGALSVAAPLSRVGEAVAAAQSEAVMRAAREIESRVNGEPASTARTRAAG